MGRMLSTKAFLPSAPQAVQPAATPPVSRPASYPSEDPNRVWARSARPVHTGAESDPAVRIAFYGGLIFLFLRLGAVPEILYSLFNTSTPILYVVAAPAFLGALFAGGVIRTLRSSAAKFWLLFFAWMIVAAPFSSWISGSVARVLFYLRDDLPLLFIIGGLAVNWKQVRAAFYTIAAAGVFNVISARFFARVSDGRLSLTNMTETLGNPNDLASQLLLVLPFVMFVVVQKKNPAIRILLLGAAVYGVYVVFGTASRGALVALGLQLLILLWCATPKGRVAVLAAAVVLASAIPFALPHETVDRLGTVFGNSSVEAEQSANDRSYLFRQSVRYTVQHPLFGVGPDQFLNYEGEESQKQGWHGLWHVTHCAYTQVSSECGVPALIFFVAGLVSALRLVWRLFQAARLQGATDIANACLCYLVGMSGYLGAIAFLSSAYSFHLPAMVGLAVSMSFAGHKELARRREHAPAAVLAGPQRRGSATFAV